MRKRICFSGFQVARRMAPPVLSCAAAIALLSACTGKTFEQFDVSSPAARSVSVDATQRFLLVKRMPVDGSPGVAVCAEPSPDAAMAVAAGAAASGTLPNMIQAALSGTRSESLASLGLRTPAIQLVRDLWYRACEGFMNGVHDPDFLNEAARKVDGLIVTLAAIDGISNAPVAPAIQIGQVSNVEVMNEATEGADGTRTGKQSSKASTSGLQPATQSDVARASMDGAADAILNIVKEYLKRDQVSSDLIRSASAGK